MGGRTFFLWFGSREASLVGVVLLGLILLFEVRTGAFEGDSKLFDKFFHVLTNTLTFFVGLGY